MSVAGEQGAKAPTSFCEGIEAFDFGNHGAATDHSDSSDAHARRCFGAWGSWGSRLGSFLARGLGHAKCENDHSDRCSSPRQQEIDRIERTGVEAGLLRARRHSHSHTVPITNVIKVSGAPTRK